MPNVKLILGDKKNKKKDDFLVAKTKTTKKSSKKVSEKKDNIDRKTAFYFVSGVGVATALSAFVVFGALMGIQKDEKLEVPKTGVVEDVDGTEDSQEETKDTKNNAKEEDTEAKKDIAEEGDNSEATSKKGGADATSNNTNATGNNATKNASDSVVKKNVNSSVSRRVSSKNSGSKSAVNVAKLSVDNSQASLLNNAKTTDSNKTFEKTAKEKCEGQVGPREYLGYEVLTTEEKGAKTSKTTYYRYIPVNGSRFKMVYKNNNCVVDLSNKKKAGEISIEEYIEALDKFVW